MYNMFLMYNKKNLSFEPNNFVQVRADWTAASLIIVFQGYKACSYVDTALHFSGVQTVGLILLLAHKTVVALTSTGCSGLLAPCTEDH